MELTCSRCHQSLQEADRFCPACGLPQLVYSADETTVAGEPDRQDGVVPDAGSVDWRRALRAILPMAIPAGIAFSLFSPVGLLGLLLMGAAAAWAVALYARNLRPAWITAGIGVRIGLVCGLLAGALAFTASGCQLFAKRYMLHQGSQIDADWKSFVDLDAQFSSRFAGWLGTGDAAQIQAQAAQQQNWMLSPQGHAAIVIADLAFASILLALFAMAGGALGARRIARLRRSGN